MYAVFFYLYALFGAPALLAALQSVMTDGTVNVTLSIALFFSIVLGFFGLHMKNLSISARLTKPPDYSTRQIAVLLIVWILHVTACIMLVMSALTALGLDATDAGHVWVGVAIITVTVFEFIALYWILRVRPRNIRHAKLVEVVGEISLLIFGCVFYTAYWDFMGIDRINDYTWTVFFFELLAAGLVFMVIYLPIKLPDLMEEFQLGRPAGRRARIAIMLGMGMVLAVFPGVKNTLMAGGRYTSLEKALAEPDKVAKLYLLNRKLADLPPEIGTLTNLNILWLTGNHLTDLPPEIGNLTSLTELHIGNNRLQSLPPEIGRLTNLVALIAYNNYIDHIPAEIGNARRLKRIQLQWNSLTNLPATLLTLEDIESIRLNGNQLTPETLAIFVDTPVYRKMQL